MRYILYAKTTDNWIEGSLMANPVIEVDLTQPLTSRKEAEFWLERIQRVHPELILPERIIPGREIEFLVKEVE